MIQRCLAIILLIGLTACGGTGAPIHYYLIDPVSQSPINSPSDLHVQIIDLQIPQYLERFQIASRRDGNRLVFADGHQWGENLRKNLTRTLSINLAELLATNYIGTPINRTTGVADYRVQVFIQRFERDPDNVLRLSVRWQLATAQNEDRGTYSRDYSSDKAITRHDDTVSNMAQLFSELSLAIATSIQEAETTR